MTKTLSRAQCMADAELTLLGMREADGMTRLIRVLRDSPRIGLEPGARLCIEEHGASLMRAVQDAQVIPSYDHPFLEAPLFPPPVGVPHVFHVQWRGGDVFELVARGSVLPEQMVPQVEASLARERRS